MFSNTSDRALSSCSEGQRQGHSCDADERSAEQHPVFLLGRPEQGLSDGAGFEARFLIPSGKGQTYESQSQSEHHFETCRPAVATASLPTCYGPEFAGKALDQWAYLNGVEIDFSRPGRPTDNGLIEVFNGR